MTNRQDLLASHLARPLLFAISFTKTVKCENQSDSAIYLADSPTFYGFSGFKWADLVLMYGIAVRGKDVVVSSETASL